MDVPVFTFRNQFFLLQWLCDNSRLIIVSAISLLMTLGTISIINNVQEINSMRYSLRQ